MERIKAALLATGLTISNFTTAFSAAPTPAATPTQTTTMATASPVREGKVAKGADTVFAASLSLNLHSIEALQLSAPEAQWLNPELTACVWQFRRSEEDCTATRSDQLYPFYFVDPSGVVISDAFASPMTTVDSIKAELEATQSRFGHVNIARSRCHEEEQAKCMFRAFTSFRAHCPKGAARCARAESIELFYFVLAHPNPDPDAPPTFVTNFSKPEEQIIVKTDHVLQLGTKRCPFRNMLLLNYDENKFPACAFPLKNLLAACKRDSEGGVLAWIAPPSSGCSKDQKEGCKNLCSRIIETEKSTPCKSGNLTTLNSMPFISSCDPNTYVRNVVKRGPGSLARTHCRKGELALGTPMTRPRCTWEIGSYCIVADTLYSHRCVDESDVFWKF